MRGRLCVCDTCRGRALAHHFSSLPFGVAHHWPRSGGAMSDVTAIEWTDHTFNPWWGCSRVSPACRFCYADRDAQRYGHQVWRRHGPRRMLSDANWQRPLRWNRDAERAGIPAKVFCASMADVFEDHPDVAAPRERRMVREPGSGPVPPLIEWVICGGESGPRARPTHPAWARSLRDQCGSAEVPFFFKQWGEWAPQNGAAWPLGDARQNPHRHSWVSPADGRAEPFGEFTGNGDLAWAHMKRVGKKAAGRELDGQIRDEFPRRLAEAGHGATRCTI